MKSGRTRACYSLRRRRCAPSHWGVGQPESWGPVLPCALWFLDHTVPFSGLAVFALPLQAKTGPPSPCGPLSWASTWLEGCGSAQGHPVARVAARNAWTLPCLALLADLWGGGGRAALGEGLC